MMSFFAYIFGRNDPNELDKQRVIELAQAINTQFMKDFILYFKDCVNLREKERHLDNLDPETLLYKSLARANAGIGEDEEDVDVGRLGTDDNPLSLFTNATFIRGIGGTTGSVPIYDLFPAPLPSSPIRQGYLIKMGEKVKSWKTRYFVAYNRSDNYIIKYYEDQKLLSCKGSINCCGYIVQAFSEEEVELHGEHGFKLIHPNEERRVWLIRAENAEEQHAWIQVFNNACKKSITDPNQDPLYTIAFQRAFRATRAAYGYFGVVDFSLTECEMLTQFTKQVIGREILDEYIETRLLQQRSWRSGSKKIVRKKSSNPGTAPGGNGAGAGSSGLARTISTLNGNGTDLGQSHRTASTAVTHGQQQQQQTLANTLAHTLHNQSPHTTTVYNAQTEEQHQWIMSVRDLVHTLVYPICQVAWRNAVKEASALLPTYEQSVRIAIDALLESERQLESYLGNRLKNLVDPILMELQTVVCEKIVRCMFTGLLRTYELAFVQFGLAILTESKNLASTRFVLQALTQIEQEIDDEKAFLSQAYDELWSTYTEDLISLSDSLEISSSGVTAFSIYVNILEDLRSLMYNAVFTMQQLISEEEMFVSDEKPLPVLLEETHAAVGVDVMGMGGGLGERPGEILGGGGGQHGSQPQQESISQVLTSGARVDYKRNRRASRATRISRAISVQRRKSQEKAKKLMGGGAGAGAGAGGGVGGEKRDAGHTSPSPDSYSPINANVLHLDLSRADLFAQYEIMLERLEHDMIQAVECRLQSTMIDAMESTIQEMVLIPAMDILQETQAKKKYKDMNFFINMYCVGERMIRDLVKTFTHVMMRKMTNEFKQLILKWRVQIYATEDIRGLIASNAVVVSVDERLHG